jgi:hypothetical protein
MNRSMMTSTTKEAESLTRPGHGLLQRQRTRDGSAGSLDGYSIGRGTSLTPGSSLMRAILPLSLAADAYGREADRHTRAPDSRKSHPEYSFGAMRFHSDVRPGESSRSSGEADDMKAARPGAGSGRALLSDADHAEAARLNRQHAPALGWGTRLSAYQPGWAALHRDGNLSGLANAVAGFQTSLGFRDKCIDGVLGPRTWRAVCSHSGSCPGPQGSGS